MSRPETETPGRPLTPFAAAIRAFNAAQNEPETDEESISPLEAAVTAAESVVRSEERSRRSSNAAVEAAYAAWYEAMKVPGASPEVAMRPAVEAAMASHPTPDGEPSVDEQSGLAERLLSDEAVDAAIDAQQGLRSSREVMRRELSAALTVALAAGPSKAWKCEACHDSRVVLDVIASTPNGDEMGDVPCPDCTPDGPASPVLPEEGK